MSRHQTVTLARTFKEYAASCLEGGWIIRQPTSKRTQRHPTVKSSLTSQRTGMMPDAPHVSLIATQGGSESPTMSWTELLTEVGKGSNFHRKNVQEYLKPLGNPKLKRSVSPQREPYPESEARQKHLISNSLENSKYQSTVLHHLNSRNIDEIIELLVDITPKARSREDPSPISIGDEGYNRKGLPRHVYTEVPTLPDFENDPHKFEHYIYTLTHSTFHFKNSSKFDGIIPKLLRNLFHPLNTNTLHLRTTNSYNYMIHFFSYKHDFATCRELLVQMRMESIKPNTTSYNLMLGSLSQVQKIQHMADPFKVALKLLKQMKDSGLKADIVTWNSLFAVLKDERSKVLLTEKRNELKIPVDGHFLQAVLQYLIETRDASTKQLLTYVKDLQIPLDHKPARTIVHRLIKEKQFDSALKLMLKLKEDTMGDLRPCIDDLNHFLIGFSEIKRVDLGWGIIKTFEKKFGVKPDYNSYNLLMKTMAVSGHWKEKYTVLRVLYHEMMNDLEGIVAGEYWLRRLRSRLKFVYEKDVQLAATLTEKEIELKKLIDEFIIVEKVPMWIKKNTPPEKKKVMQLLGYYQSRNTEPMKGEPQKLKEAKRDATKYREKVSQISINKAMEQRALYVDDQFKGLKKVLVERGIID